MADMKRRDLPARPRLSGSRNVGLRALTSRLNSLYAKESSGVDPALKYIQLERLKRVAW